MFESLNPFKYLEKPRSIQEKDASRSDESSKLKKKIDEPMLDVVSGEHLEKGREQIIKRRIYNMDDPLDHLRFMLGEGSGKIFEDKQTTLLNFYETNDEIQKSGMLGEYQNYVISPVDENSKRSYNYIDCTAIVVCGEDNQGKQISFMTHQNPGALIGETKKKFEHDISKRISEIEVMCKPSSIDIVIAGGNYYNSIVKFDSKNRTSEKKYRQSIEVLRNILTKQFTSTGNNKKLYPVVIIGPDFSEPVSCSPHSDIVFDTQARILFISRPEQFLPLTDDLHSTSDTEEYLGNLDQIKRDFCGYKPAFLSTKLAEEVERKLTASDKNQDNVSPRYEQEVYKELHENDVKVWSDFRRTGNRPENIFVNIPPNVEAFNYVGEFDKYAMSLKNKKIEEIKNFESFIIKIMDNLRVVSEKHYKINNSSEIFAYFFDESNSKIDFLIGRHGFYYLEKDVSKDYQDIIMQNVAMFLESFHRFCDEYVAPSVRTEYIRQIHMGIRSFFEENISNDKIRKIYDFM